jgi:hypothetical protein
VLTDGTVESGMRQGISAWRPAAALPWPAVPTRGPQAMAIAKSAGHEGRLAVPRPHGGAWPHGGAQTGSTSAMASIERRTGGTGHLRQHRRLSKRKRKSIKVRAEGRAGAG